MTPFKFSFSENYTLSNERALLRPLTTDDYAHLLPFALQEPTLWHYSYMPIVGPDGLQAYIENAVAAKERQTEYPFIVFDKKTGEYAGSTRFYDIHLKFRTLQLGYTWYGKKFQGSGLNKNCKYLLLSFAFEQMDMERVEFRAHSQNERSIAAMKSIGCMEEGILRSNGYCADGSRRDSIVLSIIKEDWFDHTKTNLLKKLST